MSKKSIVETLKREKQRKYLNKDFESFRADLLNYARTYFPDSLNDFSDPSVGGLLLDMAAYVGDVMSFYMDHQFSELSIETASEEVNIARLVESAGVRVEGASPAFCSVSFSIIVPAEYSGGKYIPLDTSLPIVKQGTKISSKQGVIFQLLEDVDFSKRDDSNDLYSDVEVSSYDSTGAVKYFKLTLVGPCTSSIEKTKTKSVGAFARFPTITLQDSNITEITSVVDAEGKKYHEVEYLTQDVVFKRALNVAGDHELVPETVELIPATRRYISRYDRITKKTVLTFGSGNEATLDDDIIPDPSELSIPLYGKKTLSRFSIDPSKMLDTRSFGIAPSQTTLTVSYRAGGGLHHNITPRSVSSIASLIMTFDKDPGNKITAQVRGSLSVDNISAASGGEDEPTLDDLRQRVKTYRSSQSRIVTKEDLIARVYTMPSNFGRVFRLAVKDNPANPLATRLHIISRDRDSKLVVSPDSLKKNLREYINQYRLVSDAIDILDSDIINIKINYEVIIDGTSQTPIVLSSINLKLKKFFDIKNWQIDQPILRTDIVNLIINTPGVISLSNLKIGNISGSVDGREYSNKTFNIKLNTLKKMIIPPTGGIFEIRFPDSDIVGTGQ